MRRGRRGQDESLPIGGGTPPRADSTADVAGFYAEGQRRASSRESASAAGWGTPTVAAAWEERGRRALAEVGLSPAQARLSWKSLPTLLSARHEKLVRPPFKHWPLHDATHKQRAAWVGGCAFDDFRIDRTGNGPATKFMLLGDTGEGDVSQYAIVAPLLSESDGAEFTVIASDVIYPAGASNDYILKYYATYDDLAGPTYAVPGNHDYVKHSSPGLAAPSCASN